MSAKNIKQYEQRDGYTILAYTAFLVVNNVCMIKLKILLT